MHARIVALLLVIATLWSLIGIQDLDPGLPPPEPVTASSPGSEGPRPLLLVDRVWTTPAEMPVDLPDVLAALPLVRPVIAFAAPPRPQRWQALPGPYLDGPRRPPRPGGDA